MKPAERSLQARRELDRKFTKADLGPLRTRPRSGWIRTIRVALGMSQRTLADRLGVRPPSVTKLEKSEADGRITIGKLEEVARALDCTLVYALVPNSTLQETVTQQARLVAAETLGYVGVTMGLEDQTVEPDRVADQMEDEAARVSAEHRLWR